MAEKAKKETQQEVQNEIQEEVKEAKPMIDPWSQLLFGNRNMPNSEESNKEEVKAEKEDGEGRRGFSWI